MHRLWGRRRLWQETDGGEGCYDTLWDAVTSVENASVWRDGLRNSGLNLILEDGDARGIVMVVRDESLTGCEEVEQGTLYGSCAQAIRQWLQSLGGPEGVGLLMYHWLPNATFASVSGVEQEWGTLLEVASSEYGFHGLVVDGVNDSVRVPEGVGVVSGRLGGYDEATIIEKKQVCGDEEGSGVFVLDRQLYPEDLPAVNVTSLGPLESYCWESIVRLAVSSESDFPGLPLTTFAYPVVKPLLDPRANVTLFVPDFANGAIDSSLYVGGSSDPDLFRGEITIFLLSHFLRGHHCPEDLDGNQIQTLAGEYYGEDFKLAFEQDKNDENLVYVSMLFGSNQMRRYSARYLGEACFSSVYSLNSLLTPWNTAQDGNDIPRLPFEYIDDIPLVTSQLDLFNVTNTCSQFADSEIGTIIESSRDEMQQSSSTLDGGEIAGIVIGSIAGLCIIVALCLIVWKRKKATKGPSGEKDLVSKYPDSIQSLPHHDDSLSAFKRSNSSAMTSQWTSSGMLELPWDDVILSEDEVIFDEDPLTHEKIVLGRGKFGTVYQGLLMGAEKVAVKCILDSNIELLQKSPESLGRPDSLGPVPREEVLKEISLLKACHSQYVVSFLGATFLPGEVRLITELMPAGDLWSALGRRDGTRRVTWYHGGIYIAMDVAAGLNYLHGRRVIHLDLKSSNILLRESRRSESSYETQTAEGYDVVYRAKISDVGLSRMVPMSHEYIAALEATGTWNWCAPEVILCSKCTAAADIFSYGIVLWEICTGEIPVRGCMRPVRVPEECPQEVADLIDACVNCDNGRQPSDRPTASEAFDILRKLLQNNTK